MTASNINPIWSYNAGLPKPASIQQPLPPTSPATDCFGKIASGTIMPSKTESYKIPVDILANGQIVQNGLSGPQVLGQLDAQGNYTLVNKLQGNAFHGDHFAIDSYFLNSDNPFMKALSAAQRQRATNGSEVPQLRQQLFSRGINGQGIKIGILDPKVKGPNGQWDTNPHTTLVTEVINDPLWGVAPGAHVEDLGGPMETQTDFKITADQPGSFMRNLTDEYTTVFTSQTAQIQRAMMRRDPNLRVLNMTWGDARFKKYLDVFQCINMLNPDGNYKYPVLRSAILGPAINGTGKQRLQAVVNAVDQILDSSPSVQNAYRLYVEQTRLAAQNGLTLVAAAGNEHNKLPFDVQVKPGSEMDEYAKSPYVITVAGSNTNQNPGNRAAHSIAPFSSRGDGMQWNPTIAAPGDELRIARPVGKMGTNLVGQGTSVSTPFVCVEMA